MKLISMTDFVLEYSQKSTTGYEAGFKALERLNILKNYARFLKQPLRLEMFVPCDEMIEVMNYEEIKQSVIEGTDSWDAYQKAKEKVLFEGFEIVNTRAKGRVEVRLIGANVSGSSDTIQNDFAGLYFYDSRNEKRRLHTIEGLLNFHPLKLTPTAIKQIKP